MAGYGDLWNQAPWLNNQDLYVLKDDWSAVFGKHFVKAGVPHELEREERGGQQHLAGGVQLNGSAGFISPSGFQSGLTTGNDAADLLLNDMAFNTDEIKTNPNVQQRWRRLRVLPRRLLQGRAAVTAGLRRPLQPHAAALDGGRPAGQLRPAAVNPALGNAPCNGMLYPPGTNPCPALGLAGGGDAPNRSLVPIKFLWIAPRVGVAWDFSGDGTTAVRAGIGRFYQRDRVSPGLGVGTNPPFSGTASIVRTLNSAAVVSGNPAPAFGSAPTRSRRWRQTQLLAVERRLREAARPQHGRRDRLRRQQGPRPLRADEPERGRARKPPRLRPHGQRRAPAPERHRGHRRRQRRALAAQPRVDLPLAAGRGEQPVRPRLARSASPTRGRS